MQLKCIENVSDLGIKERPPISTGCLSSSQWRRRRLGASARESRSFGSTYHKEEETEKRSC